MYCVISFPLDNDADATDYEDAQTNKDSDENFSDVGEDEYGNENALGSFTFNRNERLDVKKPGPFFPNSENNFFFKKVNIIIFQALQLF